jgi:maleate isomerase
LVGEENAMVALDSLHGVKAVNDRTHIPHRLDEGLGARLRAGVIVLASDQTVENEVRRAMALPGVEPFTSRIWNEATINPTTLAAMEDRIEGATRLILTGGRLDVVGFACTSGTMVIGEDTVFSRMRAVRPGIACSSPITAAMAALSVLGLSRIALLTPYVPDINARMRAFIEARGIEVPVIGSFSNDNDDEVSRISASSVHDAAVSLARQPQVDGLFISCTALRTLDVIAGVEATTGKPVIASNPALAWHLLRLGGVSDPQPQFGRLFTCGL